MVHFTEDDRIRIREVTINFMSNTSSHVLPQLAQERRFWRKTAWFGVLIFVLSIMIFVLKRLLDRYGAYPAVTNTKIVRSHNTVFPAVTICNENILRKSKLKDDPFYAELVALEERYRRGASRSRYDGVKSGKAELTNESPITKREVPWRHDNREMTTVKRLIKRLKTRIRSRRDITTSHTQPIDGHDSTKVNGSYADSSNGTKFSNTEIKSNNSEHSTLASMITSSTTGDLSEVSQWFRPTYKEVTDYGHRLTEMLLQCSYDGKICGKGDFDEFATSATGNCFTFNSKMINKSRHLKTTDKIGVRYGLRVTLNIEVDDYIGILTHDVGTRIAVHDNNIFPFMVDMGIGAPPGMATQIGVRMTRVNRLKHPYPSNCTMATTEHHYPGKYTEAACLETSFRDLIFAQCGCYADSIRLNESLCSVIAINNRSTDNCVGTVTNKFNDEMYDRRSRLCQPACSETTYHRSMSMVKWPSKSYRDYMNHEAIDKKWSMNATERKRFGTRLSDDLVRLQVYLSSRDVLIIDESAVYTWEDVVAQIGGLLGLFIGVSICTLFEVMELLFDVLLVAVPSVCRRKEHIEEEVHESEDHN